jgi:hypothetical protein
VETTLLDVAVGYEPSDGTLLLKVNPDSLNYGFVARERGQNLPQKSRMFLVEEFQDEKAVVSGPIFCLVVARK